VNKEFAASAFWMQDSSPPAVGTLYASEALHEAIAVDAYPAAADLNPAVADTAALVSVAAWVCFVAPNIPVAIAIAGWGAGTESKKMATMRSIAMIFVERVFW